MNTLPLLFEPYQLRDITLRNRIGVSPMCQYSSHDGHANEWHLVHLGSRAVGGAGLVMMEATAISPEGRISPQDNGIWSDAHLPMLQKITSFLKSQGTVPAIQLAHAGRKASCALPSEGEAQLAPDNGGWQTLAPSPLPFQETDSTIPQELTLEGIATIKHQFLEATKRALQAGFEIVELHAAHGYLLHSFLSPLSNQRTDQYGGSFENRTRLLREVVHETRQFWPERLPFFVRISVTDWGEGGWNPEESVQLSFELQKLGVDLIDCSSGGAIPGVKIPVGPGYQVPFAKKLKKEGPLPTAAVGMITSPSQAEDILTLAEADLIFLGREALRNPYWPLQAAEKLGAPMPIPLQYKAAFPHS